MDAETPSACPTFGAEFRLRPVRFSDGISSIAAGPLAVTAGSVAFAAPWIVLGAVATASIVLGLLAGVALAVVGIVIVSAGAQDRWEQLMAIRLAAVGLGVCSLLIFAGLGGAAWPFGVVAAVCVGVLVGTTRPSVVGTDEPHLLRDQLGADAVGEQREVQFCVFLPRVIAKHAEAIVVFRNVCNASRTLDFTLQEKASTLLGKTQALRFQDRACAEIEPLAFGLLRIPVVLVPDHSETSCRLGFGLHVAGSGGVRRVRWRGNAYQDLSKLEAAARPQDAAVRGYAVEFAIREDPGVYDGKDDLQPRFEVLGATELEGRLPALLRDAIPERSSNVSARGRTTD